MHKAGVHLRGGLEVCESIDLFEARCPGASHVTQYEIKEQKKNGGRIAQCVYSLRKRHRIEKRHHTIRDVRICGRLEGHRIPQ